MKVVGIFILALELIVLAIALKEECKKNNITFSNLKLMLYKLKHLFIKRKIEPKRRFLFRRK